MLVDTELEGHHVLWLCLTAKVMLDSGCAVVLVVHHDLQAVRERIGQIDPSLADRLTIIASPISSQTSVRGYFGEICRIFRASAADRILFNNFDTIASKLFRLSAVGYKPPQELAGKVAVIYHRPRPLDDGQHGFSVSWKRLGINRLIKQRFFSHLFLLDPFVVHQVSAKFSDFVKVDCLPDPWLLNDSPVHSPAEADFSGCKCKVLQYGVGDRRKGTELLLDALDSIKEPIDLTLAIVGRQKDPEIRARVATSLHKIILIDRFIANAEERFLFETCDVIAIPYLSHYGSSNILSKAAQYKKPVLASDFHLIGRQVAENNLGLTFHDRDVGDLANTLRDLPGHDLEQYDGSLREYSQRCSFAAFSGVLQKMV